MVTTMPKQGMMMGPMRGHLAPNSSPFKITTNKLSSQYMIQDHMSSHYTKLGTAKAAIDNKPPKSMATSVKKRDQMRREAMAKQMKLFDFEKEMKHGSTTPQRQTPDSSLYGSQQRLFSVTVSKTGYDEARPQSVSSFRSGRMSPRPRGASSPRSTRSELNSPRDKTKKPDILTQTYAGDYLDRHEERFKNVDTPFAPRLKKRPGKSYLSQSKHYAPPLVMHKETKRKASSKSGKKGEDDVSPTSSASDLEGHERSASRMEDRFNDTKVHPSDMADTYLYGDSRVTYDNIYPQQRSRDAYGFQHSPANDTFFGRSSLRRSFERNDTFSNETKSRIEAEEEELKYLEFINSVTNDILTRGIYSDRVLTQVMQRHLDQNRRRLNEGRMRHMLMKLQEDLGVSSEITLQGFSTTSKYDLGYDDSSTAGSVRRSRREKRTESESSVSKKLSYGKTAPKKAAEKVTGISSDGSDGRESFERKGILKTPGTSSGSDLDMKYTALSSGDEDDRPKSKKVTLINGSKSKVDGDLKIKEDEKDQIEVVQLINGLDLNEPDVVNQIVSEPIIPPKVATRTSNSSNKTKSSQHSLDSDQPEDEGSGPKHDKKEDDLEIDSDLDDF